MKWIKTLIVAAVVGTSTGLLASEALSHASRSADLGPTPTSFAPIGAPESPVSPAETLAVTLKSMGATNIGAAEIASPPVGSTATTPWLYATVNVPSLARGADIEPMWEADLLEGAIAERAGTSTDLHVDFAGSTFAARLPDGTVVPDESGGMGDILRGQVFTNDTDSSIASSMKQTLASWGYEAVSISTFHAPTGAPAVVVQVPDAEEAVANLVPLQKALFGAEPRYIGFYLELRDASGEAIAVSSAEYRTGAGRLWIDPRWADLSGAKSFNRHGGIQTGRISHR